MSAQRGRDLLLKLQPVGGSSYVTVAGLRASKIAFSAGTVDASDADSPGRWRELMEGAGLRKLSLSGKGLFKDAAADTEVRRLFFDGGIGNWQVVIPDFGTISGPFQLTTLDYAGTHDGEVTYEIALESAGQISFAGA